MRKPTIVMIAIIALAAVGIGSAVYLDQRQEAGILSKWEGDIEEKKGLSQTHVAEKVDYDTLPPAGGPHSAQWQNCGFFPDPVVDEAAVHSLEHGAAWITWQGSLTSEQRAFINEMVSSSQWVLASPYPEQEAAFTLTAWGLQLKLESFERDAIEGFVTKYANGPQTPEPGAPCMQGINTRR
jgi:hypothetical protein